MTAKGMRSIPSTRRPFCAGVVKSELPITDSLNVVITRYNVIDDGHVRKIKLIKLHPADRTALNNRSKMGIV